MRYLTSEQIAKVFQINLPLKIPYITQRFGANAVSFYAELGLKGHNGQDFRAKNDDVLSVFNGKVVKAIENAGYGVYVVIETDSFVVEGQKLKLQALYGHLAWFNVSEGQYVAEGQKIGLSDNCFDKETEILTDDGWKYFKDLIGIEKVATLNIKTNKIEFQKPEKYTKKFEEYMYLYERGKANFCVSEDHNMLVYCGRKYNKLKIIPFYKLSKRHLTQLKHTAGWDGQEQEYFILDSAIKKVNQTNKIIKLDKLKIKMDDWLFFLGIFLADGCCGKNSAQISQTYNYTENIKRLDDLFNRLPFHFTTHDRKQFIEYTANKVYCISDRRIVNYLFLLGKKENKHIPLFVKDLSSRQIKIFLDGFFMGDGYIRRNNEKYYYPGLSKIMADQLQELILKTGKTASISERIFNIAINYQVYEHQSVNSSVRKDDVEKIKYNDFAYCVSVPNKTLLVRRKGRPIFLGNTGKYTTGEHLHFGIRPLYEAKEGIWLTEENGYMGYIDPQPLYKYPYWFEAPVIRRYGQPRTWSKFLEEKKMAFNPWLRNKLKHAPTNSEINGFVYGFWDYESVINPAMYATWTTRTKPEYKNLINGLNK